MSIARERSKIKKDQNRWNAANKKWNKDKKKVIEALRKLQQFVDRHQSEVKSFTKKAKSNLRLISNGRSNSKVAQKKVKNNHQQQNQMQKCFERNRNNILRVTKSIKNTIKQIA